MSFSEPLHSFSFPRCFVTGRWTRCGKWTCGRHISASLSLNFMALIRAGYIVDIPDVSKDVPPNPLLGYNGLRTAPASSAGSSFSVTQSTLAHRVLLNDQRCLITGAVSNQLQACHLINTIRINESNRAEKLPLKQEVVRVYHS